MRRLTALAAALFLAAGLASPGMAQSPPPGAAPSGSPQPPSAQAPPPLTTPAPSSAEAHRPACPPPVEMLPGAQSLVYKAGPGRELRAFLFKPAAGKANRSAVVFFFGGGWRNGLVTAFEDQARAFAAKGYVAILPDYRVTCRDQTTAVDSTADAQLAYAWVRGHAHDWEVDPKRIVLSGGSAGGHLALTTAMLARPTEKPAALVLFNPAVDLVVLAPRIGLTLAAAAAISPSVLSVKGLPPTIAFHGQADTTVPIETVRAFCARAKAAARVCELNEYAGQNHGFFHSHAVDPVISASPYDDTLGKAQAFLAKLRLDRP